MFPVSWPACVYLDMGSLAGVGLISPGISNGHGAMSCLEGGTCVSVSACLLYFAVCVHVCVCVFKRMIDSRVIFCLILKGKEGRCGW